MIESVGSWKGLRPLRGWRAVFVPRVPWGALDWHVLLLAAGMIVTSLVFVRTMEESDVRFGREGIVFASHVKKIAVALPFLGLGFFLRPRWLRRHAWTIYGFVLVLLVLVPLIGEERNNARRWIPLPLGFDLQPSELAKLGLIVALARALYRNRLQELGEWWGPALLALVPMALVAAQPDLGTALTIVPVTLGLAWLAGARARTIGGLCAAGLLAGAVAFELELGHGYQLKRIETWAATLDNAVLIEGKSGAAFHAYQARVAIGHGGLLGTGLGRGVANEAGHLPERDCDSIFAVIAEESGFLGASVLVVAYLLLAGSLLAAAGRVRDRFSRLVVAGVGLYFAAHFFINVAVNLGLIPMTGLTLPLISTGGSSLLTSFLALGLALGFAARPEPSLDLDSFR
ncbi:MAG: FtsW/RodA/SpoVE family cell cycle protein [Planctomycetota bacterium]